MNNTIFSTECQEEKSLLEKCLDYAFNKVEFETDENVLFDVSASGKRRPWHKHKLENGYIALAYDDVDPNKAARLRDCSNYLAFAKEGDRMKLHDARFCRVRLCPICQWRRSLKTYAQMAKVLDAASDEGYQFLFLTLTVENCSASELAETITDTMKAFNRFSKYKEFQAAFKGYYRGFEVKYSQERNDFHPHIHTVLAVNKSYFNSRNYLSQKRLTELWKKALQVDYTPIVHVQKCYGGYKSVAEACKYAVKVDDIIQEDWDLTVELVRVLDAALDRRRFVGLGGVFKEIHKRLNLDDMEDGDLTHIEADQTQDASDEVLYFFWNGFNYYRG